MKILVIHNRYLEAGGEDRVVDSELQMLKDYGNEVLHYCRSNEEIKKMGSFEKIKFLFNDISWNRKSYQELKCLIKKEKPEIAHIHNIFMLLSPSIYLALKEAHVPVVHTLHNYRLICMNGIFYRKGNICKSCLSGKLLFAVINRCWRGSFILSAFLARMLKKNAKSEILQKNCDNFIVLSKFSREKFISAGFSKEKLAIKPNFVELEYKEEQRGSHGLFVGRLVDYKGLNVLISAYERLGGYNLRIVGEGPMFRELKEKLRGKTNIQLLGSLRHENVVEQIRRAAFTVFPSECYENMPLVILESFCCATPVIASNLGAMKELINDGVSGLLFEPKNIEDLSSKIKFLTDNKERRIQMGQMAREDYLSKFTKQINYGILMNIYQDAIANHNENN